LTKRATLAATAKVAGLERTYFCKCFRKHFGLSFLEWNTRARVEEARRLLVATKSPVSAIAIALAVGFSDLTTFERNFKKVAAVSPRRYRQQQDGAVRNTRIAENFTRNAETVSTDGP
jgi:AraC-like DNA-binding protein